MRPASRFLCALLAVLATGLGACRSAPYQPWDPATGAPQPTTVRLDLDGHGQLRNLSCESCSASDLLRHYGLAVSEGEFFAGLPRSDNPDLGFVGDVDGPGGLLPPAGYGVHAEPVAARLRVLSLPARAERGRDLAWLRGHLAQGRPAIVWATAALDARRPVQRQDERGRSFLAVPTEHTFLAVGYRPGRILLVDAATGAIREVFDARFDAAWASLGRMAVVPEQAPPR